MATASSYRVYFDTNEGAYETGYWLGLGPSKDDLAAIGPALKEGLIATIHMPNELEMDARLRFDSDEAIWWADPISGTIRFLDGA